jgi:hypothetical protein
MVSLQVVGAACTKLFRPSELPEWLIYRDDAPEVVQDIDPLILLEPVLFIALGAGLVVYWRLRRKLSGMVLLLSFIAYAGAIALKVVVQAYTANGVVALFGYVSWQNGLYYGLQTSFFEVGLAYIVARYAVARRQMDVSDAEGYGVSLAFWENAILLGALSLFNLAATYLMIAGGLLPQSVYQTLVTSSPALFYPPQQLVLPIALATLERVSSFLAHFAWGYLSVLAVCLKKPVYLAIALPMGLLDALVPFAQELPLWEFEAIIFVLSLGFVMVARVATRSSRQKLLQSAAVNA